MSWYCFVQTLFRVHDNSTYWMLFGQGEMRDGKRDYTLPRVKVAVLGSLNLFFFLIHWLFRKALKGRKRVREWASASKDTNWWNNTSVSLQMLKHHGYLFSLYESTADRASVLLVVHSVSVIIGIQSSMCLLTFKMCGKKGGHWSLVLLVSLSDIALLCI